jgi:NAD(P)-dependent dehydrogenase (short-subunit alcohol dehydrogenase family)
MKYEIPELLKEGGGVIINISSLAGLQGGGAGIGYHASKFGVVGMTKAALH